MNRALLPSLLCGLALIMRAAFADEVELPAWKTPNELLRITPDGPDAVFVSWYRHVGKAYYLQHSDDLIAWSYFPGVTEYRTEPNSARVVSYRFTVSEPDRFFVRLVSPLGPVTNPYTDDFDGDKVSTNNELLVGTDPFLGGNRDRDGDGMSNDWETRFGLNPDDPTDATGLNSDPDHDGISNYDEYQNGAFGTDPTDYYNAVHVDVAAIGWSEPTDLPGTLVLEPLVIELKRGGNLVIDGPVRVFSEGAELGQVSEHPDGTGLATSLDLRTGLDGRVVVYFKHPSSIPALPAVRSIWATVGGTVATSDRFGAAFSATSQRDYDYPPNTVGLNATKAIDDLLLGKDVATALRVFSIQDHDTQPPTYFRNMDAWCYALRQAMTCISPWNSRGFPGPGGPRGAGTAITAQHIILSAHYELDVGDTVRFVTANNPTTVVQKILRGKARHPSHNPNDIYLHNDLTIYTLDTPLPGAITPCKVLPDNYGNRLSYLEQGRPPVMVLDQEEKALVSEVRDLDIQTYATYIKPGLHKKRLEFFEGLVEGDSGNPSFLIIKNGITQVHTLVLLSTATGYTLYNPAGVGTFVTPTATLNAMIAAADAQANAEAGVPITGMTVQTIDLSGFSTFTPPP